jgi:hypothetical protein
MHRRECEIVTLILTMIIHHARYGVMLSFRMWALLGEGVCVCGGMVGVPHVLANGIYVLGIFYLGLTIASIKLT